MKITIMVPKFHENSQKRAKDDCQNGRRGNEHEPRLHAIWCNRCTNSSHSLENQGAQSLYSKQFHSFCRRLYYFLVPLLSDCPLAFFHAQASIIILFLILIYCGIVGAEVKDSASIGRHMFELLLWRKFLICLFDRTVRTEGKYELCGVLKYFSVSNNEKLYVLILLFFQIQCLLADSGTDRKENSTSGPAIFCALSYSQRFVSG